MVSHQAEGIDENAVLLYEFTQRTQVTLVVLRLGKNHLAVMSTLDDVVWVIRQDDAADPWHGVYLTLLDLV